MNILISTYLFIGGLIIILWNRTNIIKIFIGVELCLFASSWNLVYGFNEFLITDSMIFVLFILAIAAAEAAIGLGLAVQVYVKHGSINLDTVNEMGG